MPVTLRGLYPAIALSAFFLNSTAEATVDLSELLDQEGQTWTIGGNSSYVSGDFRAPFNDGDAVKMERTGEDNSVWIETTVSGPFEVRYEWTLQYDTDNRPERYEFLVDGTIEDENFEGFDWGNERVVKITSEGVHTLRWLYVDENNSDPNKNAAWLDAVFISRTPVIGAQPVSKALDAGESLTLSVEAYSESPMEFQWFKDGTAISGETSATLNLVGLSGADSGDYTVEVTNLHGTTVSAKATVFANEMSIGEAADQQDWTWTLGGNGIWARQSEITHDSEDAIAYLPIEGPHDLSLTTTVNGIGKLSFWWRSVDAPTHYGGVTFYVDGQPVKDLFWSSEATKEWIPFTYDIKSAGDHELKWAVNAIPEDNYNPSPLSYSVVYGTWIDEVAFDPQPILLASPDNQFAQEGENLSFTVSVASETTVSYQWRKNGLEIPGANSNSLTISSATLEDSGIYDVSITAGTHQLTSKPAKATVSPSIGETLNQPDLDWTYSESEYGELGWVVQSEVSYDGTPAIEFLLADNTYLASVNTTVDGPVTLSYWKRTESAAIEAVHQSNGWEKVSIAYPENGPQNIRLSFSNRFNTDSYSGRVWIDNINLDYTPIITKDLSYVSVPPGQNHVFEIQVASISEVSYQWMRDEVELPGETDSTLSLANVSARDIGHYSVRIINEHGSVVSDSVFLGVYESLGDAVEQPNIEWTFGDRTNWFAQSEVTYDGVDALMCVVPNESESETNWLDANIQGPFRISYWIRVEYQTDQKDTVSPPAHTPWQQEVIEWHPDHPPTARIPIYTTTPNARIYIDQIEILRPPFIERHPKSTSVSDGQTIAFQVGADSATPVTYQWLKEGVPIPGATSSQYSILNAKTADSGNYSVRVSNHDGAVVSKSAAAQVFPAYQSIGQAFEQSSQTWTRSSDGKWFVHDDITFDGGLALEVRAGDNNGETWFETTIGGPATIDFFYIAENDIEIYIDGVRSHLLDEASAWRPFTFIILEDGPHTVRWLLDDYHEGRRFWFDKLTVSHGPIITEHPQSKVIETGNPLELAASAVSQSAIAYQWRKDGVDLQGATSSTLTIPSASDADFGNYDVVLTTSDASATSTLASVISPEHINLALDSEGLDWTLTGQGTIALQTVLSRDHVDALSLKTGDPVWLEPEIAIETTFEGPATVEFWSLEGDTTPGFLRPTLNGIAVDPHFHPQHFQINAYQSWSKVEIPVVEPGSHSLKLSLRRYGGYATEKRGVLDQLKINQAPIVTDDLPSMKILHPGEPITFALAAVSGSDIEYQWRKDGVDIAGANEESFTIADPENSDTGHYDVVLSNVHGETVSRSTHLISNEWLQGALDAPNASFTVEGEGTLDFEKEASPDSSGGLSIKVEPEKELILNAFVATPVKTSFWWREDPDNCSFSHASFTLNAEKWQSADLDWSFHQVDGTDQRSSNLRWIFHADRDCVSKFYLANLSIEPDQLIANQPTELTGHLGEHFEIQFDWWDTTGASFQWRKDGAVIPGGTNRDYPIDSFQASDSGIYDVAITTESGTVYSDPVAVASYSERVSNALDSEERTWTSSDPGSWLFVSEESQDGVDSLLAKSIASRPAWIETVVEGPATVSFWWNTRRGCPTFRFSIDGILKRSTRDDDWQEEHVMLSEAGPHILRWELRETCGWSESIGSLDRVSIIPGPTIGLHPISKTVTQGTATELSISSISKGASYQWRRDGVDIDGAIEKEYTALLPGIYDVVVSNENSSRVSDSAKVKWIDPIGPLVEQPQLQWKMPDGSVWRASENENIDGEDALISPDYPATGDDAWLSTTVEGPINLSFAYRVANESRRRVRASFYVDDRRTKLYDVTNPWGTHQYTIPWRQFNYSIKGEGPHTLRWELSELRYIVDSDGPRLYIDTLSLFPQPIFLTQPESQGLFVSESLLLSSEATSPTSDDLVTYQWYKDNVAISGATDRVLSISNLDQSDSGNYVVKASNSSGESTSDIAQVTVLESTSTLLELGDIPFPVGNFQTSRPGTLDFYVDGPATLEFDWRLKDPYEDVPFLLEINGDEKLNRLGPNDWQTERLYLGLGVHHIKWTLRGLISHVQLNKKPFIEALSSEVRSYLGENATVAYQVYSGTPARFQWHHKGQPVPGETGTSLTLTNLELADAGEYILQATNDFGTSVGSPVSLEVFDSPGILLGLTDFEFLFSGDGQWSPPNSQNNSLCGPTLNRGQESSVSTFVNGPASIAFDARFFDQNLDHQFEFRVDDQLIYSHSSHSRRNTPSVRHTIAEPGEHELTWTITANENETAGQVFACIENLEIIADLGSVYDEWTRLLFPETATEHEKNMHADPDGDTKSNILEYLLGSDPLLADGPVPIEAVEIDGKLYWESVLQLIARVDGIKFSFESSSDLIDWTPMESEYGLEETTESTTLTIRSPAREPLIQADFIRLKLSFERTIL